MNFTEEQLKASAHNGMHARIVAVAGAGKTATLIHYIHNRLAAGISPTRLLVLMYNRAAQEQFLYRLRNQIGQTHLAVRTFHSHGRKLLQQLLHSQNITPRNLQPLKEIAIELALKQLIEKLAPIDKNTENDAKNWLELSKSFIQLVKSNLWSAQEAFETLDLSSRYAALPIIFEEFEQWRNSQQAITFDDMIYDSMGALRKAPHILGQYKEEFDEILVDEYQDINAIQHELLRWSASPKTKVIVIGDPDQTIYEFRGSNPNFITHKFQDEFKPCSDYQLSHTFRFGHELALAANQLIHHNKNRDAILTVSAESNYPTKIRLKFCPRAELPIADTIEFLIQKNVAPQQIAVLCRLWSHIRPVELELLTRNIPYSIEGNQSILQCAEIQPVWQLMQLTCGAFNQFTTEQKAGTLFSLISTPSPKISHAILKELCHTLTRAWQTDSPLPAIDQLNALLLRNIPNKIAHYQQNQLLLIAEGLTRFSTEKTLYRALLQYCQTTHYLKRLQDDALDPEKGSEQAATVKAFLDFIRSHKLPESANVNQQARHLLASLNQRQQIGDNTQQIQLSSIHRSKGLEWPFVFIPNLVEGHLPATSVKKSFSISDLESERRLMYVAMTRAQKQLFITVGQDSGNAKPSRFIHEMALEQCQMLADAIYRRQTTVSMTSRHGETAVFEHYVQKLPLDLRIDWTKPTAPISEASTTWRTGDTVIHSQLGLGTVGNIDKKRLRIQFANGQTKLFDAQIASQFLQLA